MWLKLEFGSKLKNISLNESSCTFRNLYNETCEAFLFIIKVKEEIICGIYKITSPSGRVYIGESKNILRRWKDYKKSSCKGQLKLTNSFQKYGVNAHIFEIIEECEFDSLLCRERYWQDFYDVLKKGLNCRLTECSDKKGVFSEETRKKISESRKGATASEETKQKIRDNHVSKKEGWVSCRKGVASWAKGVEFTQDHKNNLSKAAINSKSNKLGNNPKARKVINILTLEILGCMEEVARLLNEKSAIIRAKLTGVNLNDTEWMLLDEYLVNPRTEVIYSPLIVINIVTGEKYKTISECARILGYSIKSLSRKLNNKTINDTDIRFFKNYIKTTEELLK